MAKIKLDIQRLREVVLATNSYHQYENGVRNKDQVIIKSYKGEVATGEYFLCDCIGNTVDLCIATKRKFRNRDGRLVNCKVIETIIPDARKHLGGCVNGVWEIPYHLMK